MMVFCQVDYTELENDDGNMVEGVQVTCTRCGRMEESFGSHDGSVKRCFALLREDCDRNERNFYVGPKP